MKDIQPEVNEILAAIYPVLHNRKPEVIGVALSQLMMFFLASHHMETRNEQSAFRQDIFRNWCNLVGDLMAHYEESEAPPVRLQ